MLETTDLEPATPLSHVFYSEIWEFFQVAFLQNASRHSAQYSPN